jgi:hypothetical protein
MVRKHYTHWRWRSTLALAFNAVAPEDAGTDRHGLASRGEFDPAPIPTYAEQLALDVPGARVVQAFNTVPHRILELAA